MVRLAEIPEPSRSRIAELECPQFERTQWVDGPPLPERTVAIVSTAGLNRRGAKPFRGGDAHGVAIAQTLADADLVMSHVSTNFDRTGFRRDAEVVLPRRRLAELAAAGEIGAVAPNHYSFMGATDPREMEAEARIAARQLKADGADSVVLIPV